MSVKTTSVYHCDNCKKEIGGFAIYGPLFVAVRSPTFNEVNADLHFCDYRCMAQWAWRIDGGPQV